MGQPIVLAHRSRTLLSMLTTLPWFGKLTSYASMTHGLPTYQWLTTSTAGRRQCDALHPRDLSFRHHSAAPLRLIPTLLRQCVHMIHIHSLTNSSGPRIACPPTVLMTNIPAVLSSASILNARSRKVPPPLQFRADQPHNPRHISL